ncbi:MAG: hypothetical protein K0Q55_3278 [Verrucomicrobia bacterium]|jgi:hypothetical protein|nr:hypothetical protein [Verrucomicrobiota bacterium]
MVNRFTVSRFNGFNDSSARAGKGNRLKLRTAFCRGIFPLRRAQGVVGLGDTRFTNFTVLVMTAGVSIYRRTSVWLVVALTGLWLGTGCSDKKKSSPAPSTPVAAAPVEAPKPKEPPVDLKPKWEIGKRYLMREETTQEATMTLPNQPAPVKSGNAVKRDFALTILSQRPEGGQVMEAEFLASKIETRMADKVMASFDSASDPKTDRTNALAKLNRKIAGNKFRYVTDAAGNIERLEGVSNLVANVTKGLDKNSAALLKAQFSEEQLKKLGLLPEGLPAQPVAPGDSWTNNFDMPISGATAKFNVQSTLSGYEERNSRRSAIIKNTGTAQINLGNTPAAATMQFENVKLEGEAVYDVEKGQYTSSTTTMTMDIKVKSGAQEVTQPVVIKSVKTLVEVVDAPQAASPAAAK